MRAFKRTVLAASLTLALAATAAHAQTLRVGPSTPPSSTTATTTLNGAPGPTGTVGSTSSGGTTTTTTTGTTGTTATGTTAGPSISGTSTGDAFSGSSRGNAPPMGAASVQNNALGNAGNNFNANGERIGVFTPDSGVIVGGGVASGSAASGGGGGAGDTGGGNAGFNGGFAKANNATGNAGVSTTPELDRATRREAQRARRTVESRSQMMHSIAPRTNVDRTDQMPDDRSPLLSPGRP
jgi:hypothetical protein